MAAVLADLDSAPVGEPLRATLRFLGKLTRSHGELTADDARAVYAAGATKIQLRQALDVAWAFNVIDRLADTFEFHVGGPETFAASAKMLLKRGYK